MSKSFKVAELAIRDVSVLIFFAGAEFELETPEARLDLYRNLQACAARSNHSGEIAILWQDGLGATRFIAAPQQHLFFQIVSYDQLYAQVSRTMECG